MRVLIHSNAPWTTTGYGRQCNHLARQLKELGHEVAVSAFYGLAGGVIDWDGIPVFPGGNASYGVDVLPYHAANFQADVIITLMDFWKLRPAADALRNFRVLAWMPVDCTPLGRPDLEVLQSTGAQPVAMTKHGADQLWNAGFTPHYVPHGIDLEVFKPKTPEERKGLRAELGLDGYFLIGICAANSDAFRKAWPEQFEGFARFASQVPEARLMVHSQVRTPNGFPLDQLAADMKIADKVIFSDQYPQTAGLMGDEMMADWYRCLDVLSATSYAEGFGLPILEAQACGIPVVTTNASAMRELGKCGILLEGEPWWNPVHRAWWLRPTADCIADAYDDRYTLKSDRDLYMPKSDRNLTSDYQPFVAGYDIRKNARRWSDILGDIQIEMDKNATLRGEADREEL